MDKKHFKIIAFDADDTLWENEQYFRMAEQDFCTLMVDYIDADAMVPLLYEIEIKNLKYYGYGVKSFMFSMLEAALQVTKNQVSSSLLKSILSLGNKILDAPIKLLPEVEEVLQDLCSQGHKLVVATKGDLFEQETKLKRSHLLKYFHHVEVLSEKNPDNYQRLLKNLEVEAEDFLMIGNSLRSDIVPVVQLGAYALYIPYHTTWVYEQVDDVSHLPTTRYAEIQALKEVKNYVLV